MASSSTAMRLRLPRAEDLQPNLQSFFARETHACAQAKVKEHMDADAEKGCGLENDLQEVCTSEVVREATRGSVSIRK